MRSRSEFLLAFPFFFINTWSFSRAQLINCASNQPSYDKCPRSMIGRFPNLVRHSAFMWSLAALPSFQLPVVRGVRFRAFLVTRCSSQMSPWSLISTEMRVHPVAFLIHTISITLYPIHRNLVRTHPFLLNTIWRGSA